MALTPARRTLKVDAGSIKMSSGSDITMDCTKLDVDATATIKEKAGASHKVESAMIEQKASGQLKQQGAMISSKAQAMHKTSGVIVKSEASGINMVKGSLVKIN